MKRSTRRHHMFRMRDRAHTVYNIYKKSNWSKAWQHGDHICVCSCSSCGNPRNDKWLKSERLSLQERKANEAIRAEFV